MPQGMLVRVQSRALLKFRCFAEWHLEDGFKILPLARMVKLVDTYVSGAYAARCAGSSPVPGTR
jgi:hypothetical protein